MNAVFSGVYKKYFYNLRPVCPPLNDRGTAENERKYNVKLARLRLGIKSNKTKKYFAEFKRRMREKWFLSKRFLKNIF
jgi:hypothetical protein